jgi:hypothetical protein
MKSPADVLFGVKTHTFEQVAQHEGNVQFSPLREDRRFVLFTLKAIYKGRAYGPAWVRKKEFVGYIVHWYTDRGVPIKNTAKGERLIKSADFEVSQLFVEDSLAGWGSMAEVLLESQIADIRKRNGYYFEGQKLRANNW